MNPGDDDLSEKDWFAEAMDYASGSPEATRAKAAAERLEIRVREAQKKAARTGRPVYSPPPASANPAKVADAMRAFGIAATAGAASAEAISTAMGRITSAKTSASPYRPARAPDRWKEIYGLDPAGNAYPTSPNSRTPPRPPTPEEGLAAILDAVRNSPDPFKSAGEWITTITVSLAEIANAPDEDSDQDK